MCHRLSRAARQQCDSVDFCLLLCEKHSIPGSEWNWIVLFFVVSLVSGFIFKSALGIQI
jgi:hypothetical protein